MSAVKLSLCGVLCALLAANPSGRSTVMPEMRPSDDRVRNGRSQTTYAHLPIAFEPVAKDGEDSRTFRARGPGYGVHLSATEAVLALSGADGRGPAQLRMTFPGAERTPLIEGLDRLAGTNNYFIGNDPSMWKTNVPTFAKVRHADLYPGVDLIFYGSQRELEYDFIVRPGANPSRIRIKFDGARSVRLDAEGDLIIAAGAGEIRQRRPVAYQDRDSGRTLIPAEYVIRENGQVTIALGTYDPHRRLVIDPVLVYASYLGGSGLDSGMAVAVDAAGFMYVAGLTTDIAGITPMQAFVVKLNPRGSEAVYTAIFGGSDHEEARAIAVDRAGNAYVTGRTRSRDFPTVNALQAEFGGGGFIAAEDAFVAKLNTNGSTLVYSTYLGGAGNEDGWGIAVDAVGSVYVVGGTNLYTVRTPPSPADDFPLVNPVQSSRLGTSDGFVTKMNAAGSALVYSTYLGGASDDLARAVAVNVHGQAHVVGDTFSADFPLAAPFQPAYGGVIDAFVTKFNAQGSALVYSSYLGGGDSDRAGGISLDARGNALVGGVTSSIDFPVINALQPAHAGGSDAFVAKVNAIGSAVLYATYLGGSGYDSAWAVAAEVTGSAVVVGQTDSADFPVHDAQQASLGGSTDAFVTKLDAAGTALVYSTFLGGDGDEIAHGTAVDAAGNTFAAGSTGSIAVAFPVTPDALQTVHGGGDSDAFIAKIGTPCPPDETSNLDVFVQPVQAIPLTLLRYQWVIIRNSTPNPIAAPLTFALTDLRNGLLVGSWLTTRCASSESSPIQVVFAGIDNVLMPGETTATLLFLVQTGDDGIEYTPLVLRGIPVQ